MHPLCFPIGQRIGLQPRGGCITMPGIFIDINMFLKELKLQSIYLSTTMFFRKAYNSVRCEVRGEVPKEQFYLQFSNSQYLASKLYQLSNI